jgi:hypothetical protein|tara:strand:+ start:111 stop:566 length:456 start_codon:yes stop_codon:yes gene_type:complete
MSIPKLDKREKMPIQSVSVQTVWDEISPKIDLIMQDLPWNEYRKEDIYASCAAGDAAIFIDTDFPSGESFFIARLQEVFGEKIFFLWIAHSEAPETAGRLNEVISDIASNSGCSAIEFSTGSQEVYQHGLDNGFDKVLYRCRKPVTANLIA